MLSFALAFHQSSILPTERQRDVWAERKTGQFTVVTTKKGQCGIEREKRKEEEWNEVAVKKGGSSWRKEVSSVRLHF